MELINKLSVWSVLFYMFNYVVSYFALRG